ncbi:MAG: DOMON domain-containing protein [Bacteroidota bacterium]
MKQIEKNGMKVSWAFEGEQLKVEVVAPTKGWVAIGFNEQDQLVGHHLIMGKVVGDQIYVSDRYIRGIGQHYAVTELGGISHLSQPSGQEDSGGTQIRFHIATSPKDAFHYTLEKGQTIHLLIAYSQSDDFEHHSAMRSALTITL